MLYPVKADPLTHGLPLKEICDTIFPSLGAALGLSVTLRVYDIGQSALRRISYWDLPETFRTRPIDETEYISLRKGERGINASTFSDIKKRYSYIDDLNKLKYSRMSGAYLEHRMPTASEYCHKFYFRSVPVGTINFKSPKVDGIGPSVQKQLAPFIEGLEGYLRAFLLAQDADWLSLTASAYDNLHELRQKAETTNFWLLPRSDRQSLGLTKPQIHARWDWPIYSLI